MTDTLNKYLFEDRSVRIEAVHLDQAWRDARAHHQYPDAITRLLKDDQRWHHYSERGRAYVNDRFSKSSMRHQLRGILGLEEVRT